MYKSNMCKNKEVTVFTQAVVAFEKLDLNFLRYSYRRAFFQSPPDIFSAYGDNFPMH